MCYLVRQQQPELEVGGVAPPRGLPDLRPRWAGAGAIAVFGGLALAGALLTTPSMAPQAHDAKDRGAALPVAERSAQLPAGGSVQETSLQMDDGVPTSTSDVPRASAGHCHHGL
jgi:hypothetical protein